MADQLKFGKGLFGWVLFIALAVMLFMLLNKNQGKYSEIPLGDFNRLLKDNEVRWVDIGKDSLIGEFKSDEPIGKRKVQEFRVNLPEGTTSNWAFTNWLLNNAGDAGVGVDNSVNSNPVLNIMIPLIPWLLIFAFIWFFVFRQLRNKAGAAPPDALRVFVINQPGAPADAPIPPPAP